MQALPPPNTHTYMHIHVCTHLHTHAHTHTCAHMHTYMCAHAHSHMHTRICTHKCMHAHSHMCMHAHTHSHSHSHMCTHTCMQACTLGTVTLTKDQNTTSLDLNSEPLKIKEKNKALSEGSRAPKALTRAAWPQGLYVQPAQAFWACGPAVPLLDMSHEEARTTETYGPTC